MCGNVKKKILDHKVNKYIKSYYNKSLYKHPKITATMEILKRNCYFFKMRHHVTEYMAKCTQY